MIDHDELILLGISFKEITFDTISFGATLYNKKPIGATARYPMIEPYSEFRITNHYVTARQETVYQLSLVSNSRAITRYIIDLQNDFIMPDLSIAPPPPNLLGISTF